MDDKILDDDDIIDLTDLLEEGEPKPAKGKKEAGVSGRTPANEPDSFDLGKEISMEYDVSVEEIEQGGDHLDMDAGLSSGEEVALSPEKDQSEDSLGSQNPQGEVEFDFDDAKTQSPGRQEASSQKKQEHAFPGENEEVSATSGGEDLREPAGDFEAANPSLEEQGSSADEAEGKISGEIDPETVHPAGQPLAAGDILDELKKEAPSLLEGIVRPIMAELVRELVVSTREQLPGIVERVIREEIEKLKKLDS